MQFNCWSLNAAARKNKEEKFGTSLLENEVRLLNRIRRKSQQRLLQSRRYRNSFLISQSSRNCSDEVENDTGFNEVRCIFVTQ